MNEFIAALGEGSILPFDTFMNAALYQPQLGYYMNAREKFGSRGDFVTAPLISPLFSQALARTIAPHIAKLPALVEFGAGTGQLLFDVLTELRLLNAMPASVYIIELSGTLKNMQKELLKDFDIIWCDTLPSNLDAIVIANEVLDALPVKRFYFDGTLHEIGVKITEGYPQVLLEPSQELIHAVNNLSVSFASPYTSEICLLVKPWLESVHSMLRSGLVFLFDYGFNQKTYYHPTRNMGTFIGHHQHKIYAEPLSLVPNIDLTAHVDFTHVANCAVDNFSILHYTTQAHYLLTQIELFYTLPENLKPGAQILLNPHEMGELFKLMVLGKNYSFSLRCRDFLSDL